MVTWQKKFLFREYFSIKCNYKTNSASPCNMVFGKTNEIMHNTIISNTVITKSKFHCKTHKMKQYNSQTKYIKSTFLRKIEHIIKCTYILKQARPHKVCSSQTNLEFGKFSAKDTWLQKYFNKAPLNMWHGTNPRLLAVMFSLLSVNGTNRSTQSQELPSDNDHISITCWYNC